MAKEKHLYRILFLFSIILLLINDLYLKYEYHNYLTGKLSDFAGLFAFPYFFSCLFSKRIKMIYMLSGILFIFWKSEFSQPFFDFIHAYKIGINRTIDYSDLISIIILPISYKYWKSDFKQIIKLNKNFKPIIIAMSCFSFIATTLPHHYEKLSMKSDFFTDIKFDSDFVKTQLNLQKENLLEKNYYRIEFPTKNAHISTSIKIDSLSDKITRITLDSILSFTVDGNGFILSSGIDKDDVDFIRNLSKKKVEQLFSKQIKKKFDFK